MSLEFAKLIIKAVEMNKDYFKSNSFNKSCRLVCSADYSYVFEKSQKVSDNCFLILYRNNEQTQTRLGLAVAKKNAKLAVQRNRLKRLIRESFRQFNFSEIQVDCVVLIKPYATKCDNKELFEQLDNLWKKIESRLVHSLDVKH